MPNWVEQDCVCRKFRAVYGREDEWFPHWAHYCQAVAPWIQEWARRWVDAQGGLMLQPTPLPTKQADPTAGSSA